MMTTCRLPHRSAPPPKVTPRPLFAVTHGFDEKNVMSDASNVPTLDSVRSAYVAPLVSVSEGTVKRTLQPVVCELLLVSVAEWQVVIPWVLSSSRVPVANVLPAFVVSALNDANVPVPPSAAATSPTAASSTRYRLVFVLDMIFRSFWA